MVDQRVANVDRRDPESEEFPMRNNSKKQTAASRANGAKSPGPTSADGKNKSRLNALKGGCFSRDLVVTAAGESFEEFESFKTTVWKSAQPEGALQEMLTDDLVANWWRRQRVRRSESAELRSRLENLEIQSTYLRSDEIEPLKIRFYLLLERYRTTSTSTPVADINEIVTELEHARSQLASTSLGLEFLIERVNEVKGEAKSRGLLSDASLGTLRACVGLKNEFIPYLIGVNSINKTRSAKAAEAVRAGQCDAGRQTKGVEPVKGKPEPSGGEKETQDWNDADGRIMLVSVIESAAWPLQFRKKLMASIEKGQDKTRSAAAVVPTDSSFDRFSRAETAYDRRFYRALAALLTLKREDNTEIFHRDTNQRP